MPFDSCLLAGMSSVASSRNRLNFSEHFVHLTGKAAVCVLVNQQVQGLLLELYDLNAFFFLIIIFSF